VCAMNGDCDVRVRCVCSLQIVIVTSDHAHTQQADGAAEEESELAYSTRSHFTRDDSSCSSSSSSSSSIPPYPPFGAPSPPPVVREVCRSERGCGCGQ
jgi:hypothetical protein